MKVLLANHSQDSLDRLLPLLAEQELESEHFSASDEVIAALSKQSAAKLIVSNYDAENLSGPDLINAVLATDIKHYPYILFFVSHERYKQVVDALGPIAGDFLVEPFTDEELKARLMIAERAIALQERLIQSNHHSESLAIYDHLTGVLNRQAVYERAQEEHNRAVREKIDLSLAVLEITNLDDIHAEYGSQFRDQALRFVSRVMRSNVRLYDVVGRWIDAKFLLLVPGATPTFTNEILNRIANSLQAVRIRVPDDKTLELRIRVGVAGLMRNEVMPLYSLIETANQNMRLIETFVSDGGEERTRPLP